MVMDDVQLNECHSVAANKTLKTCVKVVKPKVHTKEVYECHDVTKQHCTTVWEVLKGQKVWTGNNDCKNVTWEECKAVERNVTFMVPTMDCTDETHAYMDYEPKPRTEPLRKTECQGKKEQVCVPITTKSCDTIRYKVCKQVSQATVSTNSS